MANFPSCSYHAIGNEVRPPKNFSSVGVHRSRFNYGAHELVLIIFPSSKLKIEHRFFVGFLILQGRLYQNFRIFINRSTCSTKFIEAIDRFVEATGKRH